MVIKKFLGKNETEALEAAKKELGENLVVMNVKKVKTQGLFGSLRRKMVEVTAALEDEEEPIKQFRRIAEAQVAAEERLKKKNAAAPALQTGSTINLAADERTDQLLASDGSKIEKKLEDLQTLIETQLGRETAAVGASRESSERIRKEIEPESQQPATTSTEDVEFERFIRLLYNTMLDNEISERYANEIVREARANQKPGATMDFLLSAIYQKMILKFGRSDGITPAKKGPKVVFFIGPTGVGKTTTIAKVASSFSVNEGKKIALLTMDTYRIAATDQLRTYAGILEVPFHVIYTKEELVDFVTKFSDFDYIFVDTAGHSHRNEELLSKQKEFMDAVGDLAEHQNFLVLSATTKLRDLEAIADIYSNIADYQLIFTKLDETDYFGNLFNIRMYTDKTIAYVTLGQDVPDDIEKFNAQKTVKQLLGGKKDL